MDRKNKSSLAILAGVVVLAAAAYVIVYLPGDAEQSVSDRERPTAADALLPADDAPLERGPAATDRLDAPPTRLLAGAESDEQATDEDAPEVAQKKKARKKRRQRRSQDAESAEEESSGAKTKAELPPASVLEGDH